MNTCARNAQVNKDILHNLHVPDKPQILQITRYQLPATCPQTPRNDGSLKEQAEFLLGNEGQVAHCFNVEEYSNGPFRK